MLLSGPMLSAGTRSTVAMTSCRAFSSNGAQLDPGRGWGGEVVRLDAVRPGAVVRLGGDAESQAVVEVGHLGVLGTGEEVGVQLAAAPGHRVRDDPRPHGRLH